MDTNEKVMDYEEAVQLCEAIGMKLIQIRTPAEWNYVSAEMWAIFSTS